MRADGLVCEAKPDVVAMACASFARHAGASMPAPEMPSAALPAVAFLPPRGERWWGVFLPLYALHSARSWGSGDFTDLMQLIDWTADRGGRVVATLPLLATFLDEPNPSPYLPASRLFWNEFYLDCESIPELALAPQARALIASAEFQHAIARLRAAPLVDYHAGMQCKRQVLELLAQAFFAMSTPRLERFEAYERAHPDLLAYAHYRAERERNPQSLRYWQYVQWCTHEQLAAVTALARARNVSLYLDFPLGVHPDSYDVWRYRELFVEHVAVGAPPDPFFDQGQNWGFPPMHPWTMTNGGRDYFMQALRTHCEFAQMLRLDHVMGLHRLFWIPEGIPAADGIYVRYPTAELYRLVCEASQRAQTVVVGEDLGTVPPEVRPTLHAHRLLRMVIAQYEDEAGMAQIPWESVAALNTHDMPPFAAVHPAANRAMALRQRLEQIAKSPALLCLINLEDLWEEDAPQNVPGTIDAHPNWRRKARYRCEEFQQHPQVCDLLAHVDAWRKMSASQ